MNTDTPPSIVVDQPYVVVIVLNWNGCSDTLGCIESLRAVDYPNFTTLVVDNGSSDDSLVTIRDRNPDITLLETGKNLGYAGGNNYGLHWALEHAADYVLLLNNDTVVDPGMLTHLVEAAKTKGDAGVFGAKIFFYDQPEILCYGGARWEPNIGCVTTLGWGERDGEPYSKMVETSYANGCALFAPARIFREVGLLDTGMFLIYEETDFCYRARKAGYKSWFVPDAKVWHKISAAIGGSEAPLARYFNARNQLIWGTRHLALLDRLRLYRHIYRRLLRAYFPPFIRATSAGSSVRSFVWATSTWARQFSRNLSSPANKSELLGLLDFFRKRFGDCPDQVRQWNSAAKRLKSISG